MFPHIRLSRLRRTDALRNLVKETVLTTNNFIYPVFVEENAAENYAIASMPGQYRIAEKNLYSHIKKLYKDGIRAIILFGISHNKDESGSDSISKDGLLYRMIHTAKNAEPDMLVVADNCFCEYTSHGHCGILKDGFVDNDTTLHQLKVQANICATAGCDMVAPSAMLDGQVSAIRSALDEGGFFHIPIMSYAVKYASAFYGPFRDAANSAINANNIYTDRKTYQMDIANTREARLEARLDLHEAADILMVKPAGTSLDIIKNLYDITDVPIAAYQVSGEYSAIKYAALAGALDEESAMIESLTVIKRAGASIIISYFTPDIIKLLNI